MGDCEFNFHSQVEDCVALEVRNLDFDFFPTPLGHFACQAIFFAAIRCTRTSYESDRLFGRPNEILFVRTLIPSFVEPDVRFRGH
jgi:hypothetical protein